jgi:hypothetical protein
MDPLPQSQPEADLPPPTARPNHTPRLRRYLLVSGGMILVLAALNLLLFREDGLDGWLAILLLGALPCFLYQWFAGTMRILGIFWVVLTVPFWALLGFLLWQMLIGTAATAAYRPLPPAVTNVTPLTAEQKAAYGALEEFLRPARPPHEITFLAGLWNKASRRPAELEAQLANSALVDQVVDAGPILDEYLRLAIAAPPTAHDLKRDRELLMKLYPYRTALLFRLNWLHRHNYIPEAQRLYLKQLEMNRNYLRYDLPFETAAATISNSRRIILNQQERYPGLTNGIERQTLDLVREIRASLRPAAENCWRAEMRHFQQFATEWERDPLDAPTRTGRLALSRPGLGIPGDWREALARAAGHLDDGLVKRYTHKPFYLPHNTQSTFAAKLEAARDALPLPPQEATARLDTPANEHRVSHLEPNPGGALLLREYGAVLPLNEMLLTSESLLGAYEYALAWQLREAVELPRDPATGQDYIIRETSANGIGTLHIAGGTPQTASPSSTNVGVMLKRMRDYGINAAYLIEVTRPSTLAP